MMYGRFFNNGYGGRGDVVGSAGNIIPHLIGAFVCLLVLTLVIVLIVVAVRKSRHHMGCGHMSHMGQMNHMGYHDMGGNSSVVGAITILNERYAKGEINDEDYARMKAELQK